MVRTSFLRSSVLLLSLLSTGQIAKAASPTISCTGAQSFTISDMTSITCEGSLSVFGGSIDAQRSISITSTNSIFLDNLILTAPSIYIISDQISTTESFKIFAQEAYIGQSSQSSTFPPPQPAIGDAILTGEIVFTGTNIPEPSTPSLFALGLLLIYSFKRFIKYQKTPLAANPNGVFHE